MVWRESEPRSCGKHLLAFHIVNSLYIVVTTTVVTSHIHCISHTNDDGQRDLDIFP